MLQARIFRITVSILVCFLAIELARGADKYTDENRPYEFGFKIDGQQHRHESKDKDGIIMGEFGFVTADDVYHVTVYATDKEGRFKILSMKNIHLKSSPESSPKPVTSARQGHSLALPPASVNTPQIPTILQAPAAPSAPVAPPLKKISIEPPGRSCSSCSLPTTTTRAPPPLPATGNNHNTPTQLGGGNPPSQQNYPQAGQNFPTGVQTFAQQPSPSGPNYSGAPKAPGSPNTYAQQPSPSVSNYPSTPGNTQVANSPDSPNTYAQQPGQSAPNYPGNSGVPNTYAKPTPPNEAPKTYQGGQSGVIAGDNGPSVGSAVPDGYAPDVSSRNSQSPQGSVGGRTSKQYKGSEQELFSNASPNGPKPSKPTLVSAQMQIVDKNTDINSLRPGEQRGLPPGLNTDDMSQLLYTFNYTVGFHGHFEEGYRNGVKKGYYFVTGRNGVRTRIDYVADDTGFHPKVSQEVLDLLSDDVPKEETEKDAKYGLKGYEFKWLYYPVDSRRR